METRAVLYRKNGAPLDVAKLETIDLGEPLQGEAIVQVEAAPVHLADLMYMEGKLPSLAPTPPSVAGIEGVGRVFKLGNDTPDFEIGDRVFLPRRIGTFSNYVKVETARLTKTVTTGNPVQLSLLPTNGATSFVMLTRVRELQAGEWVIQNAANSSCGRINIGIAKKLGLKMINVVRRPELIAELKSIGADHVILDGEALAQRVAELTQNAPITFAIDAIAGGATQRMAECLSVGGLLICFGILSGKPCTVDGDLLFTRNLTVKGFLTPFFESDMSRAESIQMMSTLAQWSVNGDIQAKIAATYPLEKFKDAIAHEMETGQGRDGKIVFLPSS